MTLNEQKLLFAMDYATKKHSGQVRKYTNEPYITHPFAVAGLVASCDVHVDVISAAFLHDILEDTVVNLRQLRGVFGRDVAILVNAVTDVSFPLDGSRAIRKGIDRAHLAMAPADAKTIKLADIIHNTQSIAQYDWEFAKVYMEEKRLSLEVLKEGDKNLFNVASGIIKDYFEWVDEYDNV